MSVRIKFHIVAINMNLWAEISLLFFLPSDGECPGAVVKELLQNSWKVGNRGFKSHSGLQVSKKQNVSSPPIREDSTLWGTSVNER